jgi:hypothetical protein
MHDPRISSALRQLCDPRREPEPPRWRWDIVGLERIGRIRLPVGALVALGAAPGGELRGRSGRLALVLRVEGPGAPISVDGRGRVFLPVWMRYAAAGSGMVLVGACRDEALAVVAPVGVLDGIGDLLVGGLR